MGFVEYMRDSRTLRFALGFIKFGFSMAFLYVSENYNEQLILASMAVFVPYGFFLNLTLMVQIGHSMHITDEDIQRELGWTIWAFQNIFCCGCYFCSCFKMPDSSLRKVDGEDSDNDDGFEIEKGRINPVHAAAALTTQRARSDTEDSGSSLSLSSKTTYDRSGTLVSDSGETIVHEVDNEIVLHEGRAKVEMEVDVNEIVNNGRRHTLKSIISEALGRREYKPRKKKGKGKSKAPTSMANQDTIPAPSTSTEKASNGVMHNLKKSMKSLGSMMFSEGISDDEEQAKAKSEIDKTDASLGNMDEIYARPVFSSKQGTKATDNPLHNSSASPPPAPEANISSKPIAGVFEELPKDSPTVTLKKVAPKQPASRLGCAKDESTDQGDKMNSDIFEL